MASDDEYARELAAMSDLTLAMRVASTMQSMAHSSSPKGYYEGAKQVAAELERRARLFPRIFGPDLEPPPPPRLRYAKGQDELNDYVSEVVANALRQYSADLHVFPSPRGKVRVRHISSDSRYFTDIKIKTKG